jgi:uncharacterized protein (DUF2141 family)
MTKAGCVGFFLAVLALSGAVFAQSAPPRDTPTAIVAGTGEVSGVVVTADSTPAPVRHAIVTLRGDTLPARSAITGDDGRFVFGRLPPGRFTVSATKAAFLAAAYGAKRPGQPATPINVSKDQRVDLAITMWRGGVIAGVVNDLAGKPMAGVQVAALNLSGEMLRLLDGAQFVTTDDRGAYRTYGLTPGEYAVVAIPRVRGNAPMTAPTVAGMDAMLAELVRRKEMRVSSPGMAPIEAPLPPARSAGVSPIYFPGSANLSEAARIRVAAGEEKLNVDFPAGIVPLSSISGTISGASQVAVTLSIVPDTPRGPFQLGLASPILTKRVDPQGNFEYSNVPPGRYRIFARAGGAPSQGPAPGMTMSAGGGGGGSSNQPPETSGTVRPFSYGVADVDVQGDERASVSITLLPGGVFSGQIRFEGSRLAPPDDLSKIRVQLGLPNGSWTSMSNNTNMGNGLVAVPPVMARADGTFEMGGVAPGRYLVSPTLPADAGTGWWLRSAMSGARDLLDAPPDFQPGQNLGDVVITYTDRRTELSGAILGADGAPAPDHFVLVFSPDRAMWRAGSRRVKLARPGSDGKFSVADLPPGEYLIVALGDVEGNEWQRPEFLEKVVSAGIPVTLGDGEKKVQDLRVQKFE